MLKSSVISYFGSKRNVARAMLISDQAVGQWKEIIPERAALKLEKLTNGKLEYNEKLYRNSVNHAF
ncbi:Cro/CI family transcriptional regulator [Photorhabdus temperata]|uniref:Cro/CI family transcriptional regulator n=1 Tax=Photorhabdus temperata TaxID=574560 RepID=UPI0021D4AE71|nr:Cro/CI family transcriptional regulator [Photorhabdus temperata]MCT8350214.1 Cro/CI family transcriptional regulator [Photorhabdus temperata]